MKLEKSLKCERMLKLGQNGIFFIFMSKLQINNLVRIATFFQHAGISIVFVFMPIIGKGVTDSIFEIGLLIASFSFAQILSEI